MSLTVRKLLDTATYLPIEIDRLLDPQRPFFVKFDPQLGYLLEDCVFNDGIENSRCVYNYETHGKHRRMINYADQPCRINTYGDSYTQCAQVSDGETWQEILAAHLREPMRNFGIGGYGVYHAYLRALRTEAIADLAAEYLVLNIWDDDNLRNIDATRWIRVAWMHKDLYRGKGEDTYPAHGFPWAHLRYDLHKGDFVEVEGLCKEPDDLRKLTDRDYYYESFKDDPVVHLFTLRNGGEAPVDYLEQLAEAFGMKLDLRDPSRRGQDAERLHVAYGVKSTIWLLGKMRNWAAEQNKKLMVVLSYDASNVRKYIETGGRFDNELLDYLGGHQFVYVDTLSKAADEHRQFKVSAAEYLQRFYIPRAGAQVFGHYNPYGNFWFAFAIKDELVRWLDPGPPAYRHLRLSK